MVKMNQSQTQFEHVFLVVFIIHFSIICCLTSIGASPENIEVHRARSEGITPTETQIRKVKEMKRIESVKEELKRAIDEIISDVGENEVRESVNSEDRSSLEDFSNAINQLHVEDENRLRNGENKALFFKAKKSGTLFRYLNFFCIW